jgi:ankyrin repeat protein
MTPKEQERLDNSLIDAAERGDTKAVQRLVATGANVHAWDDWALWQAADAGHAETVQVLLAHEANVHAVKDLALRSAAKNGHSDTVKVLLANSANVQAQDHYALRWAAFWGHTETVQVLAEHIFAPESWRGESRTEIEAGATALYDTIKAENPAPKRLRTAGAILFDCAIDCWFQVRPPPPKLSISPLPAQPRPL